MSVAHTLVSLKKGVSDTHQGIQSVCVQVAMGDTKVRMRNKNLWNINPHV